MPQTLPAGRQAYFIKTFGCAQNTADSERIAAYLSQKGMAQARTVYDADQIIINTCMVRQMAEDRVYGLINNLSKLKIKNCKLKIVLTGCMVGMAVKEKSGKFLKLLKERMPEVDEFLPIEEIGFDSPQLRSDKNHALVPISNGCNNFCTFCVVPFSRGREISRSYKEIINECKQLAKSGYKKITLSGMNVNSYGADLLLGVNNVQIMRDLDKTYFRNNAPLPPLKLRGGEGELSKVYRLANGKIIQPVLVKHLNRLRIPTLFPYLLKDICKIPGIEHIDFLSSNPWDFSDELIDVIAKNSKITRLIHLPVQSGSNSVLQRMNRWYTAEQYLALISKLKSQISKLHISTDIIVGFCGETEEEFQETVDLAKKVGFYKAYIAMYSDRPMTAAHRAFKDDVFYKEKKRRWRILENLINQPNLKIRK